MLPPGPVLNGAEVTSGGRRSFSKCSDDCGSPHAGISFFYLGKFLGSHFW